MVSAFQMQSYYRSPLTVDTAHTQKFFGDDEDASILDENILDQSGLDSGLEMSPPLVDSRRDSFAVSSAALFSPKTEDWQSVEMQSVPSNNPFLDQHQAHHHHPHSNNPFMQPPQPAGFATPWSGAATPMQPFDGLPSEYDSTVSLFQRPAVMQAAQTPFSNPSNQVPLFQQLGHHQHNGSQSIPTSPQKADLPWTAMSQEMKNQVMAASKRTPRPGSPGLLRSHNELRRGDGIRKKNARFDIPAERNLNNIDMLIAQSTDEQEIKELKQQKRLLRNRQAALDSRQRKKQHTERLEEDKRQYTEAMTTMQDEMTRLEREMEQLLREKQSYEAYISDLEQKQAEMIQQHTIETGALRKKINVLTSHIQSMDGPTPTPNPPASYPTGFGDMLGASGDLAMDGSWDTSGMQFGDFEQQQQQQHQQPEPVEIKQEMQLVPIIGKKSDDLEKPATQQQGGLLFMLFLVGAFVLSSRSTPSIPRVSEDVRAASASLLENVLKDAGVPQASPSVVDMAGAPLPSSSPAVVATGSSSSSSSNSWTVNAPVANVAPSMLVEMADALTQPTEQQTNEQLFSLSAAQYNGVTGEWLGPQSMQHPHHTQMTDAQRSTSQGRQNLASAMARGAGGKESVAEVYTRSLLWDQIPRDVVRTFARMVSESKNGQQQQQAEIATAGGGGGE